MPRILSAALQSLVAQHKSAVCHLLSFNVGTTAYYFAEDNVVFQGNVYLPHLIVESPIRYTQKLGVNPATVKLQNITLETAAMLNHEKMEIQGTEATLQRLYLAANEAITLFIGRIATIDIDEHDATITLVGDLDPTATHVPTRKYAATCAWTFQDIECGYTDGADPVDPSTDEPFTNCPKDFLSCGGRGRQHRFSGFIHISRDLTLAIEGQAPDAQSPDRVLAALMRPWEEL